jgi:multidrug efflux system membrane fusion protein
MKPESPTSATLDRSAARTPAAPEKKPKRWPLWLGAFILLAAGGGYLLSQRTNTTTTESSGKSGGKKGGKGAGGPVPVSVETVKQGNMGVYIQALGTVTSVYTATITSRVAGQLMEVNYKEGQIVHKGDLLAVIDARPYNAAVTQAQGQLIRDQALLENARLDLKRYQMAMEQHAIPEQQMATQQALVHQDEGTVTLDQGNLEAAKVNVDYTRITSPIDGRVGLRQLDPGNIVAANGTQALAIISQLQPITVIFTMAEDSIAEVAQQLRAGRSLKVQALDRDNSSVLGEGTVLTVDNQIDTTTGTVKVRASFSNKDYKLFPNQFVNAKLLVKTLSGVNIIPTAAIQRNNDISFVYVVDEQKKVHSRNIEIGATNGLSAAVTGVKTGEQVVTDGFDKLLENATVRVRPAGGAAGKKAPASPGDAAAQQEPDTTSAPQASGSPSTHKKHQKDMQ